MNAQNDPPTSTALTKAPEWPNVIPEIVKRRRLHCVEQTPDTAKELHDTVGFFSDGKVMPHEVEATLFEAFVENDYDGALHLTSIHNEHNTPIGIVFWREVPEKEMREWIDYEQLAKIAKEWKDKNGAQSGVERQICNDETRAGAEEVLGYTEEDANHVQTTDKALGRVRRDSLTWLARSTQSLSDIDEHSSRPTTTITQTNSAIVDHNNISPDYAHAWVKIELLAVRPPWWGQRIGSLLLACAMYQAWLANNSRCLLHVAGGTDNVPAVRLYTRFGFVPAPGIFHKPDKDIYVLGNIGLALQSLRWSETLHVEKKCIEN